MAVLGGAAVIAGFVMALKTWRIFRQHHTLRATMKAGNGDVDRMTVEGDGFRRPTC